MKIDILSSDGIQASEKDALEQMRQCFNQSAFSDKWHGFAAFMMLHPTYRDREIDLILLTHDRLLVVELKKWNGKITTSGDHWYLNNNDMGKSPVRVLADKWKILSSKIQQRLKDPAKQVWIDYRVVLCGTADASNIPIDERPFVLGLEYFLKLTTRGAYEKEFKPKQSVINPATYASTFKEFFYGPEFKPTSFSFMNFQIEGDVIFPHPSGLYREYRSVKKDDPRHQALLRRWDFSKLPGKADTTDERAKIALREHAVLGFIRQHNEELDRILLQPLSYPTRDDVDADFCELYKLPIRQKRLTEFVNRFRGELAPSECLGLVKVLISHFADLHDIRVAHRDIGDHSVWLERPSRVAISGLITAYYPEAVTVGGIREELKVGQFVLPEDTPGVGNDASSTAFQKDVYMLAVVCYYLLYLDWPPKDSGLYVWGPPSCSSLPVDLSQWLGRGMELVPNDRFSDAREMLNALNSLTTGIDRPAIEMSAFEPYRTALLPLIIYPIEENIRQAQSHIYRSTFNGGRVIVKIWYGTTPDPSKTRECSQLLAFLDKARLLKTQSSDLYPELVDFGISDAGTFLVQKEIPGTSLTNVMSAERDTREAVQLCRAILYAADHLHKMGFEHGDLSPDNIVSDDGVIRFWDLLDLLPHGAEPHSPAYCPPSLDGITGQERDCYAIAKICNELIGPHVQSAELDVSRVLDEIRICISRELNVYRIDRITAAIESLLTAKEKHPPTQIDVRLRRASKADVLGADNGIYYIGLFPHRSNATVLHLTVTGVRHQIDIGLDSNAMKVQWASLKEIQHSQFLQAANKAITKLSAEVRVYPSAVDAADDLVHLLLALPSVLEKFENLIGMRSRPAPEQTSHDVQVPTTEDIWSTVLLAEEAVLPEVEVTAVPYWENTGISRLRIPYSKTGEPLDYEADDEIEVLREQREDWVRIGYLSTSDTDGNTLAIERAVFRQRPAVGERLKFRSKQDFSSYRRRRDAVSRITAEESIIPNLLSYFDPINCPEPTQFEDAPTSEQLDAYTIKDDDKLLFTLNAQQREAFCKLWSYGPVGLLQGPPGTGKTAFIASFVHFALTRGARNILLASQSHEAVNNAAEKVVDLCTRTGISADIVRFGAEGMVSDPLRPYHSSAILESYRALFRAEIRDRVSVLSGNLGLPREFVEAWFDVDLSFTKMLHELDKLNQQSVGEAVGQTRRGTLNAEVNRRRERIATLAAEKFHYKIAGEPAEMVAAIKNDLTERFGVRNPDAIRRLDHVIMLAKEWVERLGTQGGKFEEFLAKSRTLVCGTCVGLGYTTFGVVKNRYDWVIVDEAARATASELAVAIQSGRRVLLVGDHRQLPPHYKTELIDYLSIRLQCTDKSVLKRSDFERAFGSSYGQSVGAMLQTQYRMAPAIGELVSHCFYPTALIPGRGEPEPWYSLLPSFATSTVTWIDTSSLGFEKKDSDNPSKQNAHEAREVINILRIIASANDFMTQLTQHLKEEERPIGVICMYAEQKRLIQKLLSEQDWSSGIRHLVKVDTVDSYQGKENRLIVVSLTRNNPEFAEGYLHEPERTNVALSRAKDRLIIVGAAQMWSKHNAASPLGCVLSYIKGHADEKQYRVISAPVHGGQEE